jgi:hypothetical protein
MKEREFVNENIRRQGGTCQEPRDPRAIEPQTRNQANQHRSDQYGKNRERPSRVA